MQSRTSASFTARRRSRTRPAPHHRDFACPPIGRGRLCNSAECAARSSPTTARARAGACPPAYDLVVGLAHPRSFSLAISRDGCRSITNPLARGSRLTASRLRSGEVRGGRQTVGRSGSARAPAGSHGVALTGVRTVLRRRPAPRLAIPARARREDLDDAVASPCPFRAGGSDRGRGRSHSRKGRRLLSAPLRASTCR